MDIKRNFIIISLSPWDFELGSNIREIANQLSLNHKVLFVNIPMKRTELWQKEKKWAVERAKVIKSGKNSYSTINENLTIATTPIVFEPINRLKPDFLFDILNKINTKRYAKAIQTVADEHGFKEYYLINDNDIYSGCLLPNFVKAKLHIYYLRDYMRGMSYWSTHSSRIEPVLLKNYKLVLTNSTYLASYAHSINPASYYVGQGCEVDHFMNPTKNAEPEDLKAISGVKIGYIGALNAERLDIDLIKYIADKNPSYQIVLVGPEDEQFLNSALHSIKNIWFLGKKRPDELKDYMDYFDVCINPQKVNEVTIGNYPRKIDEYLATGKPVVASHTETMTPFESVTYLAKDFTEFSEMLTKAVSENSEERVQARKALAKEHTWENSVDLMIKYLDDYEK
jgi:teichuronic acid biosynthesis glycosyltransferase TuaH